MKLKGPDTVVDVWPLYVMPDFLPQSLSADLDSDSDGKISS